MKRIIIFLFLLGMPAMVQAPAFGHPGPEHKFMNFPLLDEVVGDSDTSASDCGKLCPLPCTYLFDTLLYKGPCSAVIESCGGRPGLASCTCNGKGNRPFYMNDTKHTETQYLITKHSQPNRGA